MTYPPSRRAYISVNPGEYQMREAIENICWDKKDAVDPAARKERRKANDRLIAMQPRYVKEY